MQLALITVGDPRRLTGGYLYHARVCAGLRARGVRVTELVASAAPLDAQLAAVASFGATFEPLAYDVVVIDALARGVCAPWIAAWQKRRPLVAMVHQLPSMAEADVEQQATERALEAPLLHADRLIAVSKHGRDRLIERGAAAERIVIVSPGYDRLVAEAAPDFVRTSAAGAVRALCVAQWIPRKGLLTLVQAWARGAWPDAQLELIGERDADPAYAATVMAAIARAAPGSIVVRGIVSDVVLQQAYRAADLFVLPSRFEGYGMVYAEALAAGLPVIACNVGPMPELIGAEAGLFVPPDDVAALAAALDQMIRDPALRTKLAAGAHERSHQLPTWNDTTTGFEQALRAAIAGRG